MCDHTAATQLRSLHADLAAAQTAALDGEAAVAAERERTADLGTRVLLVDAYVRRLQRVALLLQQYTAHLNQGLAALGLPAHGEQRAASVGDWAKELEGVAGQLANALLSVCADPATLLEQAAEALLQLSCHCVPLAQRMAAAGAGVTLQALQGSIQDDLEAVNSWPAAAAAQLPAATSINNSTGSPLSAALGKLQEAQIATWEAAVQRQQRLQRLRAEVAAARQPLTPLPAGTTDEAAKRLLAAAHLAGLRAEVGSLKRAHRQAQEAAQSTQLAQRVAALQTQLAEQQQLEAAVDAAVMAMCVADARAMQQWEQGCVQAVELLGAQVPLQRQSLLDASQLLLAAQQRELAAFKQQPLPTAPVPGQPSLQPASAENSTAGSNHSDQENPPLGAGVVAAAGLLDPLARFKSGAHAASLLQQADTELQQLLPLQEQWAALKSSSDAQLADLQQTAAQLQQEVQQLGVGGGSAARQLQEAAAVAGQGVELVGRVRQALSEWWTTPAVTATPWLKRGGKTALEWLAVLAEQQRALRQREAFTGRDQSNSRRQL